MNALRYVFRYRQQLQSSFCITFTNLDQHTDDRYRHRLHRKMRHKNNPWFASTKIVWPSTKELVSKNVALHFTFYPKIEHKPWQEITLIWSYAVSNKVRNLNLFIESAFISANPICVQRASWLVGWTHESPDQVHGLFSRIAAQRTT